MIDGLYRGGTNECIASRMPRFDVVGRRPRGRAKRSEGGHQDSVGVREEDAEDRVRWRPMIGFSQ